MTYVAMNIIGICMGVWATVLVCMKKKMTTEELVDGSIKHIERQRQYQKQISNLIYELEKWQSVAVSGIWEEALLASLAAYDYEHKQ